MIAHCKRRKCLFICGKVNRRQEGSICLSSSWILFPGNVDKENFVQECSETVTKVVNSSDDAKEPNVIHSDIIMWVNVGVVT